MSAIEVEDRTTLSREDEAILDEALRATVRAATRGLATRARESIEGAYPPVVLAALVLAAVGYAEDCGVPIRDVAKMVLRGRR